MLFHEIILVLKKWQKSKICWKLFRARKNLVYSEKTVTIYIVCETNLRDCGCDDYPRLDNSLFSAVKLVKNADIDKCKYFGYGIGPDRCGTFSVANVFGRNTIIFWVDVSFSVHVDNKKKKCFNSWLRPSTRFIWYNINFRKSYTELAF